MANAIRSTHTIVVVVVVVQKQGNLTEIFCMWTAKDMWTAEDIPELFYFILSFFFFFEFQNKTYISFAFPL